MSKRRLGKGIDALLQSQDDEAAPDLEGLTNVRLEQLRPNPEQPRKHFSEEALAELSESIREKGVLQPLLVEPADDGTYLIIAGERRYRAALKAGVEQVPVIPRSFTQAEKLEIALVENLQREDLNPIEEARAYQSLMETSNATQDELSKRLGKNRSTIANALRLLRLPVVVQEAVAEGRLSPGHARAVLSVENVERRGEFANELLAHEVSVRLAERAAGYVNAGRAAGDALSAAWDAGSAAGGTASTAGGDAGGGGTATSEEQDSGLARGEAGSQRGEHYGGTAKDPHLAALEQALLERLGTRVTLRGSGRRGKIEIEYLSTSDLNRIVELIGISEESAEFEAQDAASTDADRGVTDAGEGEGGGRHSAEESEN